jgi:hypothetical protein
VIDALAVRLLPADCGDPFVPQQDPALLAAHRGRYRLPVVQDVGKAALTVEEATDRPILHRTISTDLDGVYPDRQVIVRHRHRAPHGAVGYTFGLIHSTELHVLSLIIADRRLRQLKVAVYGLSVKPTSHS